MFKDNMQMGMNVLEAARKWNVQRLLLIGTTCSYPGELEPPFSEEMLWDGYPEPTNAPYGVAKRALFTLGDAYRLQHGLDVVNVIPANLYGPNDNFDPETSHVIPAMIRKIVESERAGSDEVVLWGTGLPTREFLHVEDAAHGVIAVAKSYRGGGPINLGASYDGCEISIAKLARLIADLVGYRGQICFDVSQPDGQFRRSLRSNRAYVCTGWQAEIRLRTGLRETIDWYRRMVSTDELPSSGAVR
jgi:nucleoside-diphosphate-sugar epimerase